MAAQTLIDFSCVCTVYISNGTVYVLGDHRKKDGVLHPHSRSVNPTKNIPLFKSD